MKKKPAIKAHKIVPFNKANVLALADSIYSDKGGVISCLKLCSIDLSNGKDGGRTLHCAIGEAYYNFVSADLKPVLKAGHHKGTVNKFGKSEVDYQSAYNYFLDSEDIPTRVAIDALIDKAVLKSPTKKNKDYLGVLLASAVDANDSVSDEMSYVERSELVSYCFRQVAKLLK